MLFHFKYLASNSFISYSNIVSSMLMPSLCSQFLYWLHNLVHLTTFLLLLYPSPEETLKLHGHAWIIGKGRLCLRYAGRVPPLEKSVNASQPQNSPVTKPSKGLITLLRIFFPSLGVGEELPLLKAPHPAGFGILTLLHHSLVMLIVPLLLRSLFVYLFIFVGFLLSSQDLF